MNEKDVKTLDSLDEKFRRVVHSDPAEGDTRKVSKTFRRGHTFRFTGYERTFTLKETVTMDVTEKYYEDGGWSCATYHVDTTKAVNPAEPGVQLGSLRRMWTWLFGPRLPKAIVVER